MGDKEEERRRRRCHLCVCVELFWLIGEEEEAMSGNKVENHCDFLLTTIIK